MENEKETTTSNAEMVTISRAEYESQQAQLTEQKYVMHSPLYRLEQEFNREGLKLSRQTMANWLLNASDTWLRPIYDVLHMELCRETVLHGDETTLQVLKESGKAATSKSYMWLYRTSGCAERPIVLYEYQPSRKAAHAEEFLSRFSGWLHADGYQGVPQTAGKHPCCGLLGTCPKKI